MKLDQRIIEGKHPLTCLDIEQAREFVGKECIFSDFFLNYVDIEKFNIDNDNEHIGILSIDDNSSDYIFINARNKSRYRLILPREWVKLPKAPEFVPYTLDTWEQDFKPGDTVVFRDKEDATEYKYKFVYSGYIKHPDNLISVSFGPYLYTFYDLFNSYEIRRNGYFEPFGRKIKEGE